MVRSDYTRLPDRFVIALRDRGTCLIRCQTRQRERRNRDVQRFVLDQPVKASVEFAQRKKKKRMREKISRELDEEEKEGERERGKMHNVSLISTVRNQIQY